MRFSIVCLDGSRRDGSVDDYNARGEHSRNHYNNYNDRGSGGHRGNNGAGGYRSGGGQRGNDRRSNEIRTKQQTGDYDSNFREQPVTTDGAEGNTRSTGAGDGIRERTSIDRDSTSSTEGGANQRRRRKAKNSYPHTSKNLFCNLLYFFNHQQKKSCIQILCTFVSFLFYL